MKHMHLSVIILIAFLIGCEKSVEVRKYQETFIDPESRASVPKLEDSQGMLNAMPEDDVHAAFRSGQGQMPDDDVHAAFRAKMDQMPNDDVHAAFRSQQGQIPDDEVHAAVRTSQSIPKDAGTVQPSMGLNDMKNAPALMDSVATVPLIWKTPEGWVEKKGSGMRVATFTSSDTASPMETSIISLAGAAGGISGNIQRWIGQIGLTVQSEQDLQAFIQKQQEVQLPSGLKALIVDFTQLQGEAKLDSASMLAAIIDNAGSQIFVKMTASKGVIEAQKNNFRSLLDSLKINK